jgi:cbb3-type cytochrome oxidase subunit 3
MMSRLFQNVPVGVWTQISVVVFLVIFLVILGWVFTPARKTSYAKASRLPLEGGARE